MKVSSWSSKCGIAFGIIIKEQPDKGLLSLTNNFILHMQSDSQMDLFFLDKNIVKELVTNIKPYNRNQQLEFFCDR